MSAGMVEEERERQEREREREPTPNDDELEALRSRVRSLRARVFRAESRASQYATAQAQAQAFSTAALWETDSRRVRAGIDASGWVCFYRARVLSCPDSMCLSSRARSANHRLQILRVANHSTKDGIKLDGGRDRQAVE